MQKHLSNIASLESSQLRDEPQPGEKAPLAPGGETPCLQLAVQQSAGKQRGAGSVFPRWQESRKGGVDWFQPPYSNYPLS